MPRTGPGSVNVYLGKPLDCRHICTHAFYLLTTNFIYKDKSELLQVCTEIYHDVLF
uniref:Uncharacterized protein n=1 Tax=Anguilla anguilla TaxID=7936 RepID=A0A0E9QHV1_ANGAN